MPKEAPKKGAQDSSEEMAPGCLSPTFLALMLGFAALQLFMHVQQERGTIAYAEFRQAVREGRVGRVWIGPDRIRGLMKPSADSASGGSASMDGASMDSASNRSIGQGESDRVPFSTLRPPLVDDDALIELLEEHHVTYTGEPPSRWEQQWPTLVYLGLTVLFVLFVMRGAMSRMGPGGMLSGFASSKGKFIQEEDVDVTFADVAGADEAKHELEEIVDYLKRPERYLRLGAKIPRGVLLVGPPGTGKTLMARALAGEAGVPFISISGSDFVEMFVGVGAARVRDLFKQAEKAAPCIIFIDELDALGKARNAGPIVGGNDERESTLNQLLVEMDGFNPRKSVILLAATNRPEVLDPALLRPGRFDRQVVVDRPDRAGREAILRVHTKKIALADDVDLEEIARRTPGFAGADLANLANEAAILAARRGADAVTMKDFSGAIDRVVAGLERRTRVMDDAERERVAYHETGHALCALLGGSDERVHKISIVPRGVGALGYTMQMPDQEKYLMTARELRARLLSLVGGRAAEEVVFGEPSTGAQNDLQRATEIARSMVADYGLSEVIGPIVLGSPQGFLGSAPASGLAGGQAPPQVIEEVRGIVSERLEAAKALLERNRRSLERIARRLLEVEQLEGEELEKLLAEARAAAAGEQQVSSSPS